MNEVLSHLLLQYQCATFKRRDCIVISLLWHKTGRKAEWHFHCQKTEQAFLSASQLLEITCNHKEFSHIMHSVTRRNVKLLSSAANQRHMHIMMRACVDPQPLIVLWRSYCNKLITVWPLTSLSILHNSRMFDYFGDWFCVLSLTKHLKAKFYKTRDKILSNWGPWSNLFHVTALLYKNVITTVKIQFSASKKRYYEVLKKVVLLIKHQCLQL